MPFLGQRVLAAGVDPASFELSMARKDARLMQAEADGAGVALSMLPAFAALMDRSIAEGRAHADWTVVAEAVVLAKR